MEQNPGQFVSGQKLSEAMNCSRTAVWKRIRKLKQEGYEFEAVPRKGYRLLGKPDVLDLDKLRQEMQASDHSKPGEQIGRTLAYYRSITSTQEVARQKIREGAPDGTLIIAEEQTEGRGRMGRGWHSPPGKGIWMSVIFKPPLPLSKMPQLTLLIAVALCRAIRKQTGIAADIKWPNDLTIAGQKVCGILCESSVEDVRLRYVIAGIGISVNLLRDDYPPALRDVATSLRIAKGERIDRTSLLIACLHELRDVYTLYLEQGFAPIKLMWEAYSVSLKRPITVRTPEGEVSGVATGLDEWGALVIETEDGNQQRVFSGLMV